MAKMVPLTVTHSKRCATNKPGFRPYTGTHPRPTAWPTCNCAFGKRLARVLTTK